MRHARSCNHQFWPMLALVAGLGACEQVAPPPMPEQRVEPTATAPDAGGMKKVEIRITPRPEDLSRVDPDQAKRWNESTEFLISFGVRGCKNCPSYFMELDQTGRVHFHGHSHVARPGAYDLDVGPQQANALYRQLLDLGVLGLDKRLYSNSGELADEQELSIGLRSAGDVKTILFLYYGGTLTGSAGDALVAIVDLLRAWPPAQRFIYPNREPCYEVDNRFAKLVIESVKTNYVIVSNMGEAIGTLAFVEPPPAVRDPAKGYAVRVSDCQGAEIFVTSNVSADSCGFAVEPETGDTTFPFPGVDHPMNALLLGVEKDSSDADAQSGEWALHLLDVESDTKLRVRVTDVLSCF